MDIVVGLLSTIHSPCDASEDDQSVITRILSVATGIFAGQIGIFVPRVLPVPGGAIPVGAQ